MRLLSVWIEATTATGLSGSRIAGLAIAAPQANDAQVGSFCAKIDPDLTKGLHGLLAEFVSLRHPDDAALGAFRLEDIQSTAASTVTRVLPPPVGRLTTARRRVVPLAISVRIPNQHFLLEVVERRQFDGTADELFRFAPGFRGCGERIGETDARDEGACFGGVPTGRRLQALLLQRLL
jgi:hypothetical protein